MNLCAAIQKQTTKLCFFPHPFCLDVHSVGGWPFAFVAAGLEKATSELCSLFSSFVFPVNLGGILGDTKSMRFLFLFVSG